MHESAKSNIRSAIEIIEGLAVNLDKIPEPVIGYAARVTKRDLFNALRVAAEVMQHVIDESDKKP